MNNRFLLRIRQSLPIKLSLGILLLAVTVFMTVLGQLFLQSRHIIREEAIKRTTSVLKTTSLRVSRYLNAIETATNSCDWFVTENLQPGSLPAQTYRIVQQNINVSGCIIVTEPNLFPQHDRFFSTYSVRKGDSVITVRETSPEYTDKAWYKTLRTLGKPYWVDPFDDSRKRSLSAAGPSASYCKPLYDAENRFVGAISTGLSLRQLATTILKEHPYPHSYFIMVGDKGHYFVHPDTTRLFRHTIFSGVDPTEHPDIIALGHEMTAGNQGNMKVIIDGKPCLVCYQPLQGTGWSLALVCPDSDILQNYYRQTYIIIPLITIGLLLILLLCRRIVSKAVSPLNRFVSLLQRIEGEQYDESIPHTTRDDVIGRLQNSFATMQDSLAHHVNNIQRINNEMAKHNKELTEASRLADEADRQKTAFIQNMSHQIRTPLNIIMGFAQVLSDSIGQLPEDEVKSITDMIDHNAKTLNRMIHMLFDSSDTAFSEELNSHKNEEVLCNELARESMMHTYQHFPDIHVTFETDLPDTYSIRTNRMNLMRSLREILYNSAKYSDGKHILLRMSETDTTIRFVFEDKGPGIAKEYHDTIYMPFVKVNDLSEGLGLGLPLTKRHITNLGGSIYLDTGYTEGCRFVIELPKHC